MSLGSEKLTQNSHWRIVERPSYLGKQRQAREIEWNLRYGEGNWRYAWELSNGQVLDFPTVFWNFYVSGYTAYFQAYPSEAHYLTGYFSYAYDKELIDHATAFDPFALYNRPGHPNQFHHAALNIALEYFIGLPFKGDKPIQVREGKPGTRTEDWPEGHIWSPGRIPTTRPDLIPHDIEGWWRRGSIEDLYQSAKAIQIKTSPPSQITYINRWD